MSISTATIEEYGHEATFTSGRHWCRLGRRRTYTKALRYAGVAVVAICARQAAVVQQVADRLSVAQASTDWRQTLQTVCPDIVALATPAVLRTEVVEMAAGLGCHLLVEKPLATTASQASYIYQRVQAAEVKHAYAATHCYNPAYVWLKELIQQGIIGQLQEIVVTMGRRHSTPAIMPWLWMLSLAAGGGILNNAGPHLLGILKTISGGQLARIMGECRVLISQAPVVSGLHDHRDWRQQEGKFNQQNTAALEWRTTDADNAFSALMQLRTNEGEIQTTIVYGWGQPVAGQSNGMYFYGEQGTLSVDQMFYGQGISFQAAGGEQREVLPVPQRLKDKVPAVGDFVQNRWCALARDFVADIQGEVRPNYLTFRDGWRYQVAIEAIRQGQGWTELPI